MRKKRHNYTPEEKVSILERHLIDHVPVSDLCDEYQLQPTIFYDWQKQFFENGAAAFIRDTVLKSVMKKYASSSSKPNCSESMKCSPN